MLVCQSRGVCSLTYSRVDRVKYAMVFSLIDMVLLYILHVARFTSLSENESMLDSGRALNVRICAFLQPNKNRK